MRLEPHNTFICAHAFFVVSEGVSIGVCASCKILRLSMEKRFHISMFLIFFADFHFHWNLVEVADLLKMSLKEDESDE